MPIFADFCRNAPHHGIRSESRYFKVLPGRPSIEDRLRRNTTDRASQNESVLIAFTRCLINRRIRLSFRGRLGTFPLLILTLSLCVHISKLVSVPTSLVK